MIKSLDKENIAEQFRGLQDFICTKIEQIDGMSFQEDLWTRPEGGGGRSRVIQGNIVEKGGVNFSEVYGRVTPLMLKNTELQAKEFFATGVSIVLHPKSPHIPIIHMNVRYFEFDNGSYWFGGGIDLTPHYIIPEQATIFHKSLKNICDQYNVEYYKKFKNWADDYFFIPHREETRGVGGIFFDHQTAEDLDGKLALLNFCIDLGQAFPEIYHEQIKRGFSQPINDAHTQWMNLRRGRYVEFNLVHDRGTKFGLVSGGRTESILMSMPPTAQWEYCHSSEPDSLEHQTMQLLRKGINWIKD